MKRMSRPAYRVRPRGSRPGFGHLDSAILIFRRYLTTYPRDLASGGRQAFQGAGTPGAKSLRARYFKGPYKLHNVIDLRGAGGRGTVLQNADEILNHLTKKA